MAATRPSTFDRLAAAAPRPESFPSRLRSPAVTARVGLWLGICFGLAFLTGLYSHFSQNPVGWFTLPTRPVSLYRFTQGLHVISGSAAVPLLLVKLWSVYPKLFERFDLTEVRRLALQLLERSSIAVLVAGALWWRGSRLVVALAPGLALGIGGVTASVGKALVGRVRPPASLRLVAESAPSFPSGHATDSTAFYVALTLTLAVFVLRRPIAKVFTVLCASGVAFAIGVSRLVLGVHWPTDVLAGWLLGLAVAVLTTAVVFVLTRVTPIPTSSTPQHRVAQLLDLLNRRRTTAGDVAFRAA